MKSSNMLRRLIIVGTALFLLLSPIAGSRVLGKGKSTEPDAAYIHSVEQEYVLAIRESLTEMGYTNAGVTLTKISEDGFTHYTVTIHHRRIDRMDETGRQALTDVLLLEQMDLEHCSVGIQYLEY